MLLTAMAASGCSAHPAPRPGHPPAVDAAAAAAMRQQDAAALLTSDSGTMRQGWTLFMAQQVLVRDCMARRGYRFLTTDPGPEPGPGLTTADVDGSSSAPGYGVTASPGGAGPSALPAQDRYVRSLPAATRAHYITALSGPAEQTGRLALPGGTSSVYRTGGCLGRARTELYGSPGAAVESALAPQSVNRMFDAFLDAAQPYRSALSAWQRCMSSAGHPAQSPAALIGTVQAKAFQGAGAAGLASVQRAAAAADLACDRGSALRRVRARLRREFLARQPSATVSLLARLWGDRRRAAERAARVLG